MHTMENNWVLESLGVTLWLWYQSSPDNVSSEEIYCGVSTLGKKVESL